MITELARSLSSTESIKAYLAALVGSAFDGPGGQPVRLTYVGGKFAKAVGVTFEKHLASLVEGGLIQVPNSKRKLASFVENFCGDILLLTENPSGVYFVSLLGSVESSSNPTPTQPTPMLRFHRAIWAAFIRPLDGKRRFLNLDRIGFTDAPDKPTGKHWREIEARFILGLMPNAPVDGAALQSTIEEWAQHAEVSVSTLGVNSRSPAALNRHIEHLFELIDALPPSIVAEWSIPAAVIKHLRDRR